MHTNPRTPTHPARVVLIQVLLLNWAVASAKIIYGLLTRCGSMTADGFHSFADGASNIIGLIGIGVALVPKDTTHPYGHKKYETFYSLGIAALLLLVTHQLIEEAIKRFAHPVRPAVDVASFVVMLLTLTINIAVMRYEHKKGKILQSDFLIADALHTRSDIFISISVIVTLIGVRAGFIFIDTCATIVIALFIAWSAWKIIKNASDILCDTAVIGDVKKIGDIVAEVKGVRGYHKVRTRGRPDDIYVDLHVQLNPHIHLERAHKISYEIEEAIKKHIPEVSDVVVHLEPPEEKKPETPPHD
jgi:cation diffusion facilitator family transporter